MGSITFTWPHEICMGSLNMWFTVTPGKLKLDSDLSTSNHHEVRNVCVIYPTACGYAGSVAGGTVTGVSCVPREALTLVTLTHTVIRAWAATGKQDQEMCKIGHENVLLPGLLQAPWKSLSQFRRHTWIGQSPSLSEVIELLLTQQNIH